MAAFDEKVRVGSSILLLNASISTDTSYAKHIAFGPGVVMKQALPVGNRFIFFVSTTNELWLSVRVSTLGEWGEPDLLPTSNFTLELGPIIDLRIIAHEPFDLYSVPVEAGLTGLWLLWTFPRGVCGWKEYISVVQGGTNPDQTEPCTWLLRYVFPTLEQRSAYFSTLGLYYGFLCPPVRRRET